MNRIQVMVDDDTLKMIEEYRVSCGSLTSSDACRRLIVKALKQFNDKKEV